MALLTLLILVAVALSALFALWVLARLWPLLIMLAPFVILWWFFTHIL